MWNVEDFEAQQVVLDFSSSGGGSVSATAIEAAGIQLFNAIEFIDVDETAIQVAVCECCGYSHCSPGGWVAFRRIGDKVLWIPAWDMMDKGDWEQTEYQPPSFLMTKGAPVFEATKWAQLRAYNDKLPAIEKLPLLNSREATRLCQWLAPGSVLGKFPAEPRLRREFLIAVTDGEVALEADEVDKYLLMNFGTIHLLSCVPSDALVKPIEFWLDLPRTPGWTSFGRLDNRLCFLFEGNLALLNEHA